MPNSFFCVVLVINIYFIYYLKRLLKLLIYVLMQKRYFAFKKLNTNIYSKKRHIICLKILESDPQFLYSHKNTKPLSQTKKINCLGKKLVVYTVQLEIEDE